MIKFIGAICGILLLAGCQSTEDRTKFSPRMIKPSYLSEEQKAREFARQEKTEASIAKGGYEDLDSPITDQQLNMSRQYSQVFSSDDSKVTFAANDMPMADFIHYIFGDILKANYVIGADIKSDKNLLTLNVNNATNKADVFLLIADLLNRYQVTVDYQNKTFFLQKAKLSKAKAAIGIGREISDVPQTSGQILQVIPLKYGIKLTVEKTIRQMIEGEISVDIEQSSIFVLSNRTNVVRAIELVNILDIPANRGKHIGLLSLTYISTTDYLDQIAQVLQSEGILVGKEFDKYKNVLLIPLPHIGAIAVFAAEQELLDRVKYWSAILDQPSKGESAQYFVYTPKYARASDLGESLGQLLTLGRPSAKRNRKSTGSGADQIQQTENAQDNKVINTENVSFVVDDRTNSLIFSTTGSTYQTILPLLNKLDILPKQIILEVMIAEVTLTDEFKYGVEWALKNNSEVTGSGSFGSFSSAIGATNFTWIGDSASQIKASFFQENSFVNVISNPTLLVRDSVSASINVGTQIPVQSGTVVDDGVTVSNTTYRDTGVDVNVTPTVNAQGVVIMDIALSISNTVAATADSNTPSIFQRTLKTEAVVNSGQTVILGGLISENSSNGDTKVPILGDLPLVGGAFRGKNDTSSKTELVMLVTPKVVETNEQWQKLLEDFQTQVENVRFVN